jgi:hypothetical protein
MGEGNLIQLIYASSARQLLSQDEIMAILEVSRKNNAERNITGILLYKDGNFLQVLEGDEEAVTWLYQTIERDQRHKGLILLARRKIAQREFPDWSMGFVNLDTVDPDSVPGYSNILNEPFGGEAFSQRPSLATKFIEVFRRNIR